MTIYAYDTAAHRLAAFWDTGIGAVSHPVARVHPRTPDIAGLRLARALTRMSESVWLAYSAPLLDAVPVAEVRRAVLRPHVAESGLVRVEPHPILESAHRVGRELRELGSAGVTRAVLADVEDEADAAERAGCGDLTGRAQQAVMITRLSPSPAQIVQADRLLQADPMCSERLYTDVEPAAAAVAALHWFLAASTVAATAAGTTPADALDRAIELEHIDDAVPRVVLRLVASDDPERTPLLICRRLLQVAMSVSRGALIGVPDPESGEPCFTTLDPARPARSLLDGLVGGIQAMGALHAAVDPGADTPDQFDAAVRAEAAACAPRRLAELLAS